MHLYAAAYWYVAPCPLDALHGLPAPCALPYMPDPFQAYNALQSTLLTRRVACVSCLVPCQATSMTREGALLVSFPSSLSPHTSLSPSIPPSLPPSIARSLACLLALSLSRSCSSGWVKVLLEVSMEWMEQRVRAR